MHAQAGGAGGGASVEKKLTIRLVMPGELVGQGGKGLGQQRFVSPPRGSSAIPEGGGGYAGAI